MKVERGQEKPKRAGLKDQRYISEGREKAGERGVVGWGGGENVGAPTFKVLLEGYLILTKYFEWICGCVELEAVSVWDSNGCFPEMKKGVGRSDALAASRPV